MKRDIRIGTASWTDPGFVEDWYPRKLPASARLRWYAEHFNYVEVNATFYALPTLRTVERWCDETPDDFLFDIKLPKLLSRHSMQSKFLPPDLRSRVETRNGIVQLTPESERLVIKSLLEELKPLCDAKKLGAFLLQLSPAFRPKNHTLSELDSLRDLLDPHPLAVELRNRDWVTGEQLPDTLDYPERFAQEALGHKSAAVHRAYAKKAKVRIPSLEEYEKKIVPMPVAVRQ